MAALLSNKYLLFVIRVILGALFIYSAFTKIIDPNYFAKALYNYRILPEQSLNFFALLIPSLELIIGLLLVLGVFVRECALLGSFLMFVFITAIGIAVARNLDIECGCFGTKDGSRVGLLRIVEDLIVLLGFIWLSIRGSEFLSVLKLKKTDTNKPGMPF
jgi:putative oxidoreductase